MFAYAIAQSEPKKPYRALAWRVSDGWDTPQPCDFERKASCRFGNRHWWLSRAFCHTSSLAVCFTDILPIGEMRNMTWGQVDLKQGIWHYTPSDWNFKTGKTPSPTQYTYTLRHHHLVSPFIRKYTQSGIKAYGLWLQWADHARLSYCDKWLATG